MNDTIPDRSQQDHRQITAGCLDHCRSQRPIPALTTNFHIVVVEFAIEARICEIIGSHHVDYKPVVCIRLIMCIMTSSCCVKMCEVM